MINTWNAYFEKWALLQWCYLTEDDDKISSEISSYLVDRTVGHEAKLVSRAVERVVGRYFRSFVDFARSGAVEAERLAPTADAAKMVLSPDVEVYSLLRFPFCGIDFGSGAPFFHMRGYVAEEGLVFLVPSLSGNGSVYAYVNLFRRDMDVFKDCCYSLLAAADGRL
ncbi:hypothetical protein EJB05_55946, partial [Eragrostis curvula]